MPLMIRVRRARILTVAVAVAALSAGSLVSAMAGAETWGAAPLGDRASPDNPWQPLTPGLQSVARGYVNAGSRRLPHIRVYTVTDVVKVIHGVRSVAVLDQDIDGGQIVEQAIDYLSVDARGTIWYRGSYTEGYEGGRFLNALDGWLDGRQGAKAGIFMPARPRVGTPSYYQQQVPGLEATTAQVVKTRQSKCVPFRCFKNVVVILEGGDEYKYYAPGVGGIRTEPRSSSGGPQETEDLINVRQLGARGLADISAEVLKLDKRARTTMPDAFGAAPAATRKP
jgi:hypothetical protein